MLVSLLSDGGMAQAHPACHSCFGILYLARWPQTVLVQPNGRLSAFTFGAEEGMSSHGNDVHGNIDIG